MNNKQILIIPDVHGRTFWKEAINKFPNNEFPNMEIIFLGDYLDPYTGYEDINKEQAYDNFKEIIEVAQNDKRITLLIGNHDWHYFVYLDDCRIDKLRERNIEKIFIDNIQLFRLSKTIEINNHKYVFSHAGITYDWLNTIRDSAKHELDQWNFEQLSKDSSEYKWTTQISKIDETFDFDLFEESLKHFNNRIYTSYISMISKYRGGWYLNGSLIWADIHEHLYTNLQIPDIYQIFAHTISYPNGQYDYYVGPFFAMLDASQAFILNESEKIQPIEKI